MFLSHSMVVLILSERGLVNKHIRMTTDLNQPLTWTRVSREHNTLPRSKRNDETPRIEAVLDGDADDVDNPWTRQGARRVHG